MSLATRQLRPSRAPRAAVDRLNTSLDSIPPRKSATVAVIYNSNLGGLTPRQADQLTGRRAAGGPVSSYGTYLVGEQGPELLRMGAASGTVIPNHQIARGGDGASAPVDLAPLIARLDAVVEGQDRMVAAYRRETERRHALSGTEPAP